MRTLVLLALLALAPTLASAEPTWSTAFAPVGFDEAPAASFLHGSSMVVRGSFTRLGTTALHGLGTWDGSTATDLGAGLAAYVAGTGNIVQRLGDAISWNGDLVVYCQYGPSSNVFGGRSLFAFDGTQWRQLPDPPYAISSFPDLYTIGSTLVVNTSFDGTPDGARIALLDDQENWSMLAAPVPDVTPDPFWEGGTPVQAKSVAVVGSDLYAYTETIWLEYNSPTYAYHFWRLDRYDGLSWQPVTSGQEMTNGPAMGGCCETVWRMELHSIGTQLFRYLSSGYANAPDHAFEELLSNSTFSTTDMMPPGTISVDRFVPVPGGLLGSGAATGGKWVGSFDGSAWDVFGQQINGNVTAFNRLGSATYVFGDFTSVSGQDISEAALYENGTWAPAFGLSMAPLGTVRSIVEFAGAPHVATEDGQLPGTLASIGSWNGTGWTATGAPGISIVPVLFPWNGDLLAGGDVHLCAGGTCDHAVTRLQSGAWTPMGGIVSNHFCVDTDCYYFETTVEDFQEFDGGFYSGGNFMQDGTQALLSGVARWSALDGQWQQPANLPALSRSAGFFAEPWVRSLDSWQGHLLIGGEFSWNAVSAVSLLGYDGSQAIPLGSSLFAAYSSSNLPSVADMLVTPDGLYVCGKLRPDTPSDPLAAIAFQPTGQFPDGSWSALGSGIAGTVDVMIPYDEGILVGGQFSAAGGVPCNSIAYWDGTQWSAPIEGVTNADGTPGSVRTLAKIGNDLHVGGSFTFAGTVPSANYAILEQVTTVATEPAPTRVRTALLGVAPNPFNPSTEIRFSLQHPAGSHLDLYDTAGRRIRSFDLGQRPPGEGSVRWNGTDGDGRRVASGVYFVRLESGGIVDQTRAVLLK